MSELVRLASQQACPPGEVAVDANRTISHQAPHNPILPRFQRQAARRRALRAFVDTYGRDTHRLLTDLADVIGASIAYIDRPTVEALLERSLSDREWAAVAQPFTAMAFDEHVGDASSLPTDWIEDVLARAGVPGRGHTAEGEPAAVSLKGGA